jgi:hypothetical protein
MALDIPIVPHGRCEYCEGGVAHAELAASAVRLRTSPIAQTPATMTRDGRRLLHVIGTDPGAGCMSCRTH